MSLLTPTKHASITAWAASIPSLRLHYADPTAHHWPLEPVSILLDAYASDNNEAIEEEGGVEPVVVPHVEFSEDMIQALGGNVIDWTYFHPDRTVRWAPWEFTEEREEGFFTDMSGLTDVSVTTEDSREEEDDEEDDDEDDDGEEKGSGEEGSKEQSNKEESSEEWEEGHRDYWTPDPTTPSTSPSTSSSNRQSTPGSSVPSSSSGSSDGRDTPGSSQDVPMYFPPASMPYTIYLPKLAWDEEFDFTDHEAVLAAREAYLAMRREVEAEARRVWDCTMGMRG